MNRPLRNSCERPGRRRCRSQPRSARCSGRATGRAPERSSGGIARLRRLDRQLDVLAEGDASASRAGRLLVVSSGSSSVHGHRLVGRLVAAASAAVAASAPMTQIAQSATKRFTLICADPLVVVARGIRPRAAPVRSASTSRTIVTGPSFDELDLHARAEDSCLDGDAELAQRRAEVLVERLGDLRTRRAGERRPVAPRRVGDERELADDERGAADVEERAVELAVVALEDAQARDLAGEAFRFGLRVAVGDAEQDERVPRRSRRPASSGRATRAGRPLSASRDP